MTDLSRELDALRPHARPAWSDERERAVLAGLQARRRRRGRARVVTGAALVLAVVVAGAALVRDCAAEPSAAIAARGTAAVLQQAGPGEVRFLDGSLAEVLGPESRLEVLEEKDDGSARLRLASGRARFEVTPNPRRSFRVDAGPVSIEVVGTAFVVERTGDAVTVAVSHGRVRVREGRRVTELTDGQRQVFAGVAPSRAQRPEPPSPPAVSRELPPAPPPAVEPPPPAPLRMAMQDVPPPPLPFQRPPPLASPRREAPAAQRLPGLPAPTWRELARDGLFDQAYALLEQLPESELRADTSELLLAADVFRLAAHPQAALSPLRRVLDESPTDPRAPLAAFTLGRVLLDELGNPREAAVAFRRAEELDPRGSLAEDALAREVEAWSRAGEATLARESAARYAEAYPRGRRLGSVKRFGGLE